MEGANGNGMVGTVAKAAVSGALKGASQGGGLLSAPFKAIKVGGNAIQGIARNLHSFDKKMSQKSRFKPISAPTYENKVKQTLGIGK